METKEKAKDLIDKYYSLDFVQDEADGGGGFKNAKQLALMEVKSNISLLEELYYNGSRNIVLAEKIEDLIDIGLYLERL